jgi:hypothetical protein
MVPSVNELKVHLHPVAGIPDEAKRELLGQKLGRAPVQMEIDTALKIGGWFHEIIGKPRDRRKLMSFRWIEISITGAAIDGSMPQAEIRSGSVTQAGSPAI